MAVKNNAKVKFLTDARKEDIHETYARLVREGKIEIKFVDKLPKHLWVIDNNIRIERPHEYRTFGKSEEDVAIVFKDFPEFANVCSEEFDEMWTSLF